MFAIATLFASCSTHDEQPKTNSDKHYSTLTSFSDVGEIHNASLDMFYDQLNISGGYDSVLINDEGNQAELLMTFLNDQYGLDTTGGRAIVKEIFAYSHKTTQEKIEYRDSIFNKAGFTTNFIQSSLSLDSLFEAISNRDDSTNTIAKIDSIYNGRQVSLSGSELVAFQYQVDVAKDSYLYWSTNAQIWSTYLYPASPLGRPKWLNWLKKICTIVAADIGTGASGAALAVKFGIDFRVGVVIGAAAGSTAAGLL